jgi:hypothetical protein
MKVHIPPGLLLQDALEPADFRVPLGNSLGDVRIPAGLLIQRRLKTIDLGASLAVLTSHPLAAAPLLGKHGLKFFPTRRNGGRVRLLVHLIAETPQGLSGAPLDAPGDGGSSSLFQAPTRASVIGRPNN